MTQLLTLPDVAKTVHTPSSAPLRQGAPRLPDVGGGQTTLAARPVTHTASQTLGWKQPVWDLIGSNRPNLSSTAASHVMAWTPSGAPDSAAKPQPGTAGPRQPTGQQAPVANPALPYNKTLQLADYAALDDFVQLFEQVARRAPGNVDHYHRRWEYAMALGAVLDYGCHSLLDIGSGGSYFAPMAALCGVSVTCVDPSERVGWAAAQAQATGTHIAWQQHDFLEFDTLRQFDAVVCLSTIEHVVDDAAFFDKALSRATRLVFLTTDFAMDGQRYSPHHLRTYSPTTLFALAHRAADWHLTETPAWQDDGKPIFGAYNFASLCLCTT